MLQRGLQEAHQGGLEAAEQRAELRDAQAALLPRADFDAFRATLEGEALQALQDKVKELDERLSEAAQEIERLQAQARTSDLRQVFVREVQRVEAELLAQQADDVTADPARAAAFLDTKAAEIQAVALKRVKAFESALKAFDKAYASAS
uniref:Uncharacterized protein n=1 Tax=Phaeomonas parva TaxID=124430 RepID=A0A7S1XXB2_9STRA